MKNFVAALHNAMKKESSFDKRNLLSKVVTFVFKGEFSSYDRAKEIVQTYSFPLDEGSKKLGVNQSYYTKKRSQVSQELYRLFGDTFFEDLEAANDIRNLNDRVERVIKGYRPYDLIPTDILSRVDWSLAESGNSGANFNPGDCADEITFLREHSLPTIKEELSHLDMSKLGYLIGLFGDSASYVNRDGLTRVLLSPVRKGE